MNEKLCIADTGKDWESIIPENLREKVDEEERQQQLLDLHLPPRNRKTIKQLEQEYDSDHKGKGKADDSEDSDSDDDEDEERPRKKGKGGKTGKEKIKGFTAAEIRRFIKSYKKFAKPLTRLVLISLEPYLFGIFLSFCSFSKICFGRKKRQGSELKVKIMFLCLTYYNVFILFNVSLANFAPMILIMLPGWIPMKEFPFALSYCSCFLIFSL